MRSFRRLLVVLALAGAAGCGDGPSAGGDDPASAVPADAALYVEATVRPEGGLRDDALAAAGKVLRTDDPAGRIRGLVDQALAGAEDPRLDYGRDVEPWLGEKAGFWLSVADEGAPESRGVGLLSATDEDAAREALDRAIASSGETFAERSYNGVDYKAGPGGNAIAVAEGFAMLGTEPELKRTIDALEGDSLAEADRYGEAIGELPDERLAHFFADSKALVDAALRADPEAAAQFEQFRGLVPVDRLGPVAGSFSADGSRLAAEAVTSAEAGGLLRRFGAFTGTGSTPLLGELPGDAWGALGSPRVGESLKAVLQQVAGALGGVAIAQQLRSELGIDLEQDVFSWMGDAAFFVRGTSPDAVEGGAVISVTDEERAASAFGKLIGVLRTRGGVDARPISVDGAQTAFAVEHPGAPKPVVIARSASRVVVALGADAAAEALAPDAKLADADAFGEARSLLGDGVAPAFLLALEPVLALVQASGAADADFERARPYLEAFSVLASGGKIEDDRARSRFVAGLK